MPPAEYVIVGHQNPLDHNVSTDPPNEPPGSSAGGPIGLRFLVVVPDPGPGTLVTVILAGVNPLGDDLVVLLVLALGGALAVGNTLALVRGREDPETGEIERPPVAPSVTMVVVGLIAAIWALVSLVI